MLFHRDNFFNFLRQQKSHAFTRGKKISNCRTVNQVSNFWTASQEWGFNFQICDWLSKRAVYHHFCADICPVRVSPVPHNALLFVRNDCTYIQLFWLPFFSLLISVWKNITYSPKFLLLRCNNFWKFFAKKFPLRLQRL